MHTIIVEFDSLFVVNAIKNGRVNASLIGMTVSDCISFIIEIPRYMVSTIKRSANQVVHLLTRASILLIGPSV